LSTALRQWTGRQSPDSGLRQTAMKIAVRKHVVGRHDGLEQFLRNELGLRDCVTLDRTVDKGMHGSLNYVFTVDDDEDGPVKCSGYSSLPPVPTVKLTVHGEQADRLFGCSLDELRDRHSDADRGFDH